MKSSTDKMQAWGEHIRKLRNDSDLSQENFAKLFGKSGGSTVSAWEKGEFPDLATLIKIAEHFKLTVGQLLGEKEIPARGAALELTIREIVNDELDKRITAASSEKTALLNVLVKEFAAEKGKQPP